MKTITPRTLKRGLLFFWALWLSVVLLTNVTDLLRSTGILPRDWTLASGNYALVAETVAGQGVSEGVASVLFAGVIVWEALAALLLWRAWLGFAGRPDYPAAYRAFGVSLALWAAFIIADELFIAYGLEGTHMGILTSQLVTLIALRLLPDDATS